MRVEVTLPDAAFWRLADEAERRGQTVAQLIADLMMLSVRRIPEGATDPVVARWRKGWTDKQIAADLNLTNLRVTDVRRRYGLPANSTRVTGQQMRRSA